MITALLLFAAAALVAIAILGFNLGMAVVILYNTVGVLYFFITPSWQRNTAVSIIEDWTRSIGEPAPRWRLHVELFIAHFIGWPSFLLADLFDPPDRTI